jgi:hypothetical protein
MIRFFFNYCYYYQFLVKVHLIFSIILNYYEYYFQLIVVQLITNFIYTKYVILSTYVIFNSKFSLQIVQHNDLILIDYVKIIYNDGFNESVICTISL